MQEAYETHEAKLQRNVKRQLSNSSEIYSTMAKKHICSILSKNILLENDKRVRTPFKYICYITCFYLFE